MSEREGNPIPFGHFVTENGAHELATSEDMQPYLRLAMALLKDVDPTVQLDEVARLPLEKRYIWRVASTLNWGFADFDDVNVETDRATICQDDLEKVLNLLKLRPAQFCLFLKALVGKSKWSGSWPKLLRLPKGSRHERAIYSCCPW